MFIPVREYATGPVRPAGDGHEVTEGIVALMADCDAVNVVM